MHLFFVFLFPPVVKVRANVVLRQSDYTGEWIRVALSRRRLARLPMAPDALSRQCFAFISICREAESEGRKSVAGEWRSSERKRAEREVSD